jgi:hypothetical protein
MHPYGGMTPRILRRHETEVRGRLHNLALSAIELQLTYPLKYEAMSWGLRPHATWVINVVFKIIIITVITTVVDFEVMSDRCPTDVRQMHNSCLTDVQQLSDRCMTCPTGV